MKQKLFGAAAVVALLLTATSCNDQKQSEFNFDSVTQEVTISAKITYDAGVEIDSMNPSGYKIANAKPAVGRKVFVEIPYAQYAPVVAAAAPQGNKIFETVTDENGVFTITVPTRSTGVNGSIRLEEFTAIHREYVKMENGKPVFKTQMYSYDTPAGLNNINLKPGMYKFPDNNDISYVKHALDMEDFDESVTIAGNINLAYETGFRQGAFKSASNANVEFEIAYVGIANPFTFGTTTDANGNYKIVLPMRSLSEGFTINSIQVLGIGDNAFKHWVSDTIAEPETIKGAYRLAGIYAGAPLAFANVIDGITYDLGAKNLIFTPYYNAGITNIPAPENWTTDLIGWSAGRGDLGFDETYNKTVTLTGKVYMPYLKEYGVGAYKNERQTIKISSAWVDPVSGEQPYNNGLIIITDEDGSFSVDLPVNGEDDLRPFAVELEKDMQPFEFKGSKKNTSLYDGTYGNVIHIQEEGVEWYELGDYFFKFTPDAGNTPDEWNANLIGWYRDPVFKKINPEKTIKGQFLYAVETSYGKGTYEAKPFIVTIKAAQAGEANRFFAVKPDANGYIEFDLPLKDELDQPVLTVNDANFPTKEYVHYTEYGKSDTRLIEDIYTEYVYSLKKDPEWNEKIGTRYYKFAVATAPANLPSTFHKELAGWYKRVDGDHLAYEAQVEASGEAKLAYETGFLAGTWKNAEGLLVNVTVDGDDVEVLTDNTGAFKLPVPIKKTGFEAVLAVGGGANIKVDNFLHYKNATETQILSGEYAGESVAKDDAKWYELGTVYYTFTPSDLGDVKPAGFWNAYCKDIAGWKPAKNGYKFENKSAVTGSIKVISETQARVGKYVAFQNLPVKITVEGQDYVGATDKDGKFSIDVLRKYSDDEPAVNFDNLSTFSSDHYGKFTHYRKVGNNATEKLEGEYAYSGKQDDPSDKWNKLGIKYYTFNNTTLGVTDWHTDLPGYNIYKTDEQTEITIYAKVMRAVEKWFDPAKGVWEDEGNNTATVTVDGIDYPVPVKSGEIEFTLMKKEAPAKVTLTIVPDDYKVASFDHWTNKNKETSLDPVKNYKYTSANNIAAENCNKEEGNIYKPAKAAKMILYINPGEGYDAPEGWTQYTWNPANDNKD